MKKLLLTIVAVMFCASTISAAPATAGGGATAKKTATKKTTAKKTTAKKATTTKKATTAKTTAKKTTTAKKQAATKTASAAATKAEQRQEERQEQYGLMPSELDNLNHNVFHADAAAIRGALDTESALRYLPFVTIVNTAGFGSQFDLRGQGRLSANGVQLYINGVPSNPVDSYHSAMPINTVIPRLIQDIEVFPGSGAILYGSGTKGGTINIITSKRQAPYFLVGGGYVNTMATEGHSFNVFASAAENLGQHAKMNAGLAFSQMGGPREGDSQMGGEAVIGAFYDIGWGQYLNFDADFYFGKTTTTPYNSLFDAEAIENVMFTTGVTAQNTDNEFHRHQGVLQTGNINPSRSDRKNPGDGEIETTQMRLNTSLAYTNEITRNLRFDASAFYGMNSRKYDTYTMNLPYFVLGNVSPTTGPGYIRFLPRPSIYGVHYYEGQRADWHFLDQSGSSFSDNKFGAKAQFDWKHSGGELIVGLDGRYELSNRKSKNYLREAINDGRAGTDPGQTPITGYAKVHALEARLDSTVDISSLTAAVFIMENYRFNRYFSIMGGMRYEMKSYDVNFKDSFEGSRLKFNLLGGNTASHDTQTDWNTPPQKLGTNSSSGEKKVTENYGNFIFELSPVFRYSNTGSVYARGEFGYIAPPAWALLQRYGSLINYSLTTDEYHQNPANPDKIDYIFGYQETQLDGETYYTAELGWKEFIGTRRIPLGFTNFNINAMFFSASVFYTQSQNEFYFLGDTWSGMQLGNYDKSRRMGVEVAFEQYLLGGILSFNESFTYLKAERFYCNTRVDATCDPQWNPMPYLYDYKATFGASVDVGGYLEIADIGINVWIQNSLYGNQTVYSPITVVNSVPIPGAVAGLSYSNTGQDDAKLDPYIISDIGISLNINKNAFVITTGIKNVFDTFYYDYFNADRDAAVNENRYVIGRGRTVFIEGQYKY